MKEYYWQKCVYVPNHQFSNQPQSIAIDLSSSTDCFNFNKLVSTIIVVEMMNRQRFIEHTNIKLYLMSPRRHHEGFISL